MLVVRGNLNINRWEWDPEELSLEGDDIPSDLLRDFLTTEGQLSVFLVPDTSADVRRVAIALACTRGLQLHDFVTVEYEVLRASGWDVNHKPEHGTPDGVVNNQHCNIEVKSAYRLFNLAHVFLTNCTKHRIQRAEMRQLILESIDVNFPRDAMKGPIVTDLGL